MPAPERDSLLEKLLRTHGMHTTLVGSMMDKNVYTLLCRVLIPTWSSLKFALAIEGLTALLLISLAANPTQVLAVISLQIPVLAASHAANSRIHAHIAHLDREMEIEKVRHQLARSYPHVENTKEIYNIALRMRGNLQDIETLQAVSLLLTLALVALLLVLGLGMGSLVGAL